MNENKKNEILCGLDIYPILKYMENNVGYNKMCELVVPLGVSISYLLDKSNYVSLDYYNKLIEKLIDVTNNDNLPYKVFSDMDTKVFLDEVIYSSYSSNIFKSLKFDYKFIFNLIIYNKINMICNYETLPSSDNSLKIKFRPKNPNKFNRYYCLSFKGFLYSLMKAFEFKNAITKEIILDDENLIFEIIWKKESKFSFNAWIIITLSMLPANILLFNMFYDIKNLIYLFFIYGLISCLILLTNKTNNYKVLKQRDIEKNNELIKSIGETVKNHDTQLNDLNEFKYKNKYLSIINQTNLLIGDEIYFTSALFEVLKIFIRELNLSAGFYYQFDNDKKVFSQNFELFNENNQKNENKILDIMSKEYSFDNYKKITKIGYPITFEHFLNITDSDNPNIQKVVNSLKNSLIYLILIEISESYLGFYLLFDTSKTELSDNKINELFIDIVDVLKIGFKRITSRNVIENILSNIPTNVIIFSPENFQIKYVNNIFISSFPGVFKHYTKQDIVNKNIFSVIPINEDEREKVIKFIKVESKNNKSMKSETKIGLNLYEYNVFIVPNSNESEKIVGIIITDITETIYFQHQLMLNEKLIALGKVASGVAHEINNPLYAILANAEQIAEDENIKNESKQYAEKIVDYVMNISSIIKDLSIYSKTLRREEIDEVDINEVIEESLKLIQYSTNLFNIKIIKKLSEKLPSIKIRKGEFQQVILNLINNGIQAIEDEGKLTIETILLDDEVQISITDTGCGIKKEDRDNIFDLYFTTKKPGQGTGQGLHIVKKIVNTYKGKITFESEDGKGSTFKLKFKV